MKTFKKAFAFACLVSILLSLAGVTASAAEGNVTYTGNSGDIVFSPGSEYSPTDLFPDFKNVMPGASLTQKITVHNKARADKKVKIFLRSLGATDESSAAFLDQLRLTVRAEGDTPLFDAEADKTAGLTDWVCLGTLYSDGQATLNVTLDVPTTLDNEFQNLVGKLRWQFVVEEYDLEEPEFICLNCGSNDIHIRVRGDQTVYFFCDHCKADSDILCPNCDGKMRMSRIIIIGGETYVAYPIDQYTYKTKDGNVIFEFSGKDIMISYVVDGVVTDVRTVRKYELYDVFTCVDNENHHTDPAKPPQTGDRSHVLLWGSLMGVSLSMLFLLLLFKRKKEKDDGETEGAR